MIEFFRNNSQSITDNIIQDWSTQLKLYEIELNNLLNNSPNNFKPRIRHQKNLINYFEENKLRRKSKPFNEEEILKILKEINLIKDNNKLNKIFNIIKENENNLIKNFNEINLSNLKPLTLLNLKNFLKYNF